LTRAVERQHGQRPPSGRRCGTGCGWLRSIARRRGWCRCTSPAGSMTVPYLRGRGSRPRFPGADRSGARSG